MNLYESIHNRSGLLEIKLGSRGMIRVLTVGRTSKGVTAILHHTEEEGTR